MRERVKYGVSILAVFFAAFLYGVDEQLSFGAGLLSLLFFLYVFFALYNNKNIQRTCYILLFTGGIFISTLWDSYYVAAKERYYLAVVLIILGGMLFLRNHKGKLLMESAVISGILLVHTLRDGVSFGFDGFGPKFLALIFMLPVGIMLWRSMTGMFEKTVFLLALGVHCIHVCLVQPSTYWILSLVLYLSGLSLIFVEKEGVKKYEDWVWCIPCICALGLTMLRGDDVNYYCAGAWNLIMKVVGVV